MELVNHTYVMEKFGALGLLYIKIAESCLKTPSIQTKLLDCSCVSLLSNRDTVLLNFYLPIPYAPVFICMLLFYIYIVNCLEADSNRRRLLCNSNYFCYHGYSGKDQQEPTCASNSWTVVHHKMMILLDYVCCIGTR